MKSLFTSGISCSSTLITESSYFSIELLFASGKSICVFAPALSPINLFILSPIKGSIPICKNLFSSFSPIIGKPESSNFCKSTIK